MPPRTADKQLLLKKLSQKGPTRKTGKKRTKKAGEPHSITRLIGGPRVLDDSFVSQSDPRLMLSDHQGISNQDNGALYPHTVYPFKFFVYFHERLLQMRAANASAPDVSATDEEEEAASDPKSLSGLSATVVHQMRTPMDSPDSLGRDPIQLKEFRV